MRDLKLTAAKYFKAFSTKDLAALESLYSDNCTLRDWEIFVEGKAGVLEANKSTFESVETISIQPMSYYRDKNTVLCEIEIVINEHADNTVRLLVLDLLEFNNNGNIKSIRAFKG